MPNDDELAVALDAIAAEAEKWRGLSVAMNSAHTTIGQLTLKATAFFAGHDLSAPIALPPKYEELQALAHKLSSQAATEFLQISGAMARAHRLYEQSDGKAEKNMREIYGS